MLCYAGSKLVTKYYILSNANLTLPSIKLMIVSVFVVVFKFLT